jgi:tRNA (adenine22-N1)-methyltransferase
MNVISIDDRLKDIASLVDNCDTIADVGTDHGYLPIYLIQTNKVKKAIASDVAKGPLSKAKENIEKYQLNDKISTTLCSGLSLIPSGVDTIIMAGMGSMLMINIINEAPHKYNTYILQANLNVPMLRKFLSENNFVIVDEKVSFTHKKFYEILKVKQGKQQLNEMQIKYGPINLINKSPNFIKKWEYVLKSYKRILDGFKGSESEKNRLNDQIDEITNMLNNSY